MSNEVQSKAQDKALMDAIQEYIVDSFTSNGKAVATNRNHDRSLSVAFGDGRVVTLVLYGPRGKA